jgi:hypothetical protein
MKVRYQADADLDGRIVRAVRRHEPRIDFQFASAAQSGQGLTGLPDDQVLAVCAQEGRILITHDRRTMPTHFAEFIATQVSPGVFIVPRGMPLPVAVEWLLTIWEASEAEEWVNTIFPIPR